MHAALEASRQRVLTARTALGAAVVGAQSVVSELEAALLAVSEEARRPHREVSVREVIQLSQRLGYVVSAPFGWAVSYAILMRQLQAAMVCCCG